MRRRTMIMQMGRAGLAFMVLAFIATSSYYVTHIMIGADDSGQARSIVEGEVFDDVHWYLSLVKSHTTG